MSIRPLHDRVVVKRKEGEVIAVGTGRVLADGMLLSLAVKIGDRVLFGKHAGQSVKFHGAELLLMREADIMAVLEN